MNSGWMFEHEQIEANERHCLLCACLKISFDTNINGNNSTDNYNNNSKKIVISMYQDSG